MNWRKSVQIYRLADKDGPASSASVVELPLPDKPSIVVLPFVNMSADAEQSYLVDGLTEDLITDLSKVSELFVIARNSSFAYKGRSVDVPQIARELGVKYLLEGSCPCRKPCPVGERGESGDAHPDGGRFSYCCGLH